MKVQYLQDGQLARHNHYLTITCIGLYNKRTKIRHCHITQGRKGTWKVQTQTMQRFASSWIAMGALLFSPNRKVFIKYNRAISYQYFKVVQFCVSNRRCRGRTARYHLFDLHIAYNKVLQSRLLPRCTPEGRSSDVRRKTNLKTRIWAFSSASSYQIS